MDAAPLLSTFGLVLIAELGDKTQIAALALAARHPWKPVFLGAALAFAVLNAAAVGLGTLLYVTVPLFWVRMASGLLFLGFGAASFRGVADQEAGARERSGGRGPFLAAFGAILLAELGDKTQIATASLAAQYRAPLAVFAGSCAALWLVSLAAVALGSGITRRIPMPVVRRLAGIAFLGFGAAAIAQALTG